MPPKPEISSDQMGIFGLSSHIVHSARIFLLRQDPVFIAFLQFVPSRNQSPRPASLIFTWVFQVGRSFAQLVPFQYSFICGLINLGKDLPGGFHHSPVYWNGWQNLPSLSTIYKTGFINLENDRPYWFSHVTVLENGLINLGKDLPGGFHHSPVYWNGGQNLPNLSTIYKTGFIKLENDRSYWFSHVTVLKNGLINLGIGSPIWIERINNRLNRLVINLPGINIPWNHKNRQKREGNVWSGANPGHHDRTKYLSAAYSKDFSCPGDYFLRLNQRFFSVRKPNPRSFAFCFPNSE